MEIKKIENYNYVMFPWLQHCGLKPEHVNRDVFKAEFRHVQGHGDYWLLHYLPNHLAKAREFQACLTRCVTHSIKSTIIPIVHRY